MSKPLKDRHFDAAVIGAGMAGLAAGIRLVLAGKKTILLERHNVSGGLNSFYSIDGRKYDVGLHAVTNYMPKGTKGTPLGKLLRQLRIDYDALELRPQNGSRIRFPDCDLKFSNDFQLLESEVARNFPRQIDGFRRLTREIRQQDAFALESERISARRSVRRHITDRTLEDMLFCPVMYYGSAEEHDMDYGQFVILFRSLFFEGFARPFEGVRVLIRLLQNKYRTLGGVRKMKLGVRRIQTEAGKAKRLLLDDGTTLSADHVLSTIGAVETHRLCDDAQSDDGADAVGRLSFVETINVFDRQPAEYGWDDTIVFFNTRPRFHYARCENDLVDPTSGVLCFPNNYRYGDGRELTEGFLRITALANHDAWCRLPEDDYRRHKEHWHRKLQAIALRLLPPRMRDRSDFENAWLAKDMFTPRTIRKFTGHLNGAVYGTPDKVKDGRTHLENLYLAGTDQGFLGIIGAMLSGISMANLHIIRKS